MTHDELQKVRNALAVATTHFARDRNVVLDAIVILNNALAEPPQRTWVGLAAEDRLCAKYMQDAPDGIEAVIEYIEAKLKELNT
jgi:hypothetical protein